MEDKRDVPQIRKYLMSRAAASNIPISGTFELTPLCNMNCRMCYIRMSAREMHERGTARSADEWIEMGRVCAENGLLFLLLTGGEPFMRRDFKQIYTGLKKFGLIISINSNGTMITEEIADFLVKDAPSRVNITLYGGSDKTYERLCGNPHGYTQAVRGIKLLAERGIDVFINASFTKFNADDMYMIFEFADKNNLTVNPVSYMFPPVRNAKDGETDGEVRFTPEEAGKMRFQLEKLKLKPEEFKINAERIKNNDIVIDMDTECDRTPDEKMGCMAGRGSFWITWDGRMTPCGMMNTPVTMPFETGFMESFRQLNRAIDELFLPAECAQCKMRSACPVCGALTMAESGGCISKKPEYLCRMTCAYLEAMKNA